MKEQSHGWPRLCRNKLNLQVKSPPYGPNLHNQPIMNNWYNLLESLASCLSNEAYAYFDNNPHLIPSLVAYNAEHGCNALGVQNIFQIIENQIATGDGSEFECRANYYQFIQDFDLEGDFNAPELFEMIGWLCPCGEYNGVLKECVINYLTGFYKTGNETTVIETENDEITNVTVGIGPYSCESFYLEQDGPAYKTTITWWEPSFVESSLIPPTLNRHSYRISIDIRIVPLPGELECDIKNQLAFVFNVAAWATVNEIGASRSYKLSNGETICQEIMEGHLKGGLMLQFPLSNFNTVANIPAVVELAGYPLIPVIPDGENPDDCCN